jgi:hypothetical protein
MNKGIDMDAFKELVARNPNVELMNIEEAQALVFWSGAAAQKCRLMVDHGKNIAGMQAQCEAWVREGQIAGELELRGQQRLGKLARETSQELPPLKQDVDGRLGGRSIGTKPPKWQRLGFKSEKAMDQAEFLQSHAEEVNEVIEEAKQEGDFISKGAVKAKVRAKKAEKRYEESEKRFQAKEEKENKKLPVVYPKAVKDYFTACAAFRQALELAIRCEKQGMFAPESLGIMQTKHESIREMMDELEGGVK